MDQDGRGDLSKKQKVKQIIIEQDRASEQNPSGKSVSERLRENQRSNRGLPTAESDPEMPEPPPADE